MRKKIWSLILSLSMIAGLFTAVPAAQAATNTISIKYYKDAALTQKTNEVYKGDEFYVVITMDGFDGFNAIQTGMHYNSDVVTLLNVNDGTVLNLNGNDVATGFGSNKKFKSFKKGDLFDSSKISPNLSSDLMPPEVQVDKEFLVIYGTYTGQNVVSVSSEMTYAIMRFKADNAGTGDFEPATAKHGEGNYIAACPDGFSVKNAGVSVISTINAETLTVKDPSAAVKLGTPDDIKYENGNVIWNAVDNASKYLVSFTVKEDDNVTVATTTANAATNSIELPVYDRGDVWVTVKAIGDGVAYLDGNESEAQNVYTYKKKLSKVTGFSWNGTVLNWANVAGAESYDVKLYKNINGNITSEDLSSSTNSIDLTDKLVAPEVGRIVYYVEVAAIGDKYSEKGDYGKSADKAMSGKVNPPTNLEWSEKAAVWNLPADTSIIQSYEMKVYKDDVQVGDTIKNISPSTTQYNLASVIDANGPGVYSYKLRAIGKGEYAPSDEKNSKSAEFSVDLLAVDEVTLDNSKSVSWIDDQNGVSYYKIAVYKNNDTDPIDTVTANKNSRTADVSSIINDDIAANGKGSYYVTVLAMGDGTRYKDSKEAVASDKVSFANALEAPQNVVWNGTKATWSAVTGAISYGVTLYYGVELEDGTKKYIPFEGGKVSVRDVTEFDYNNMLIYPGEYYFTVQAYGDNKTSSSSTTIRSEEPDYVKTVTEKGTVTMKLFKDEACTEEATEYAVGDIVYMAFVLEGTDPISSMTLPFVFDKNVFNAVNGSGVAVTADNSADAVLAGEQFTLVTAKIDNQNGFTTIMLNGVGNSEQQIDGEVIAAAVRMVIGSAVDNTEVTFATMKDEIYDGTAPAGAQFSNNSGRTYVGQGKLNVSVEKKVLSADKPVWDGKYTAKWNEVDGAEKYEVTLYKNGAAQTTVSVPAGKSSYAFDSYMRNSGEYTFTVKPIAAEGDANYETGIESEPSDKSVIQKSDSGATGGSSGGFINGVTTKPVIPEFEDIKGHWAEEAIENMTNSGAITGYPDGSFKPDWGITRAEFTKLMVSILGLNKETDSTVYDDTANHWARNYIAVGTKYGIVKGIGDNLFDPDTIITREQMALIIYRIGGMPTDIAASGYTDRLTGVSDWARDGVDYVTGLQIMKGYEDNTFRGVIQTTRAEAAMVLDRLMKMNFFEGKIK